MTRSPAPDRDGRPDPGPFAGLLRRHRLAVGLSQRELADRAGLSERALRDLERGATAQPRRASVHAVAAALGLRGDELTRFLATASRTKEVIPLLMSTMDDLVGRSKQLRQLADLVTGGRHRLVTVTGAGGVGKSRLVAEVVAALRHQAPPGGPAALEIRTLDLAGLADHELVAEAISQALDATPAPPGRCLLVLDRFEHLLPAAPAVAELVRRRTGLTVLVTSQRPLRVGGEHVFRLEPLPIGAAVELFARRAAAVAPGFALGGANTAAVTAICLAVEGLPLAVELAAARVRLMSPAELAARLDRSLPLLASGAADLPARQRSLRATIEASLDVVTDDARTLFAWLGAFAGGGLVRDLEAVAAALGRDEQWLRAALGELIDTSLVRVIGERHTMPQAMTELARWHLGARADRVAVERALAVRFLQRVRDFASRPHRDDRHEAANVRAAARYAIAHDLSLLDRETLRALALFHEVTGRPNEGRRLMAAIAQAGAPIAHLHAGRFARLAGDLAEATRLGHLAMSGLGPADNATIASIRMHLGAVATEAGDSALARKHFRAVLASARRSGDAGLIGGALNNLGALSAETGRLDDAERLFSAALEARRRSGAGELLIGDCLHNLAEVALEMGRYELALSRAAQATAKVSERLVAHAAIIEALALVGLGRVDAAREAVRRAERWLDRDAEEGRYLALIRLRCSVVLAAAGETARAAAQLSAAVPVMLASTPRYHDEAATWLEAHARLLAVRDPVTAARLLGAAHSLRRRSSRLVCDALVSTSEAAATQCREALGGNRFEQEHRAGARLDAVALAGICARIHHIQESTAA